MVGQLLAGTFTAAARQRDQGPEREWGHLLPTLVPEVGADPGTMLQERKDLEGHLVWLVLNLGGLGRAGGSAGLGQH